MTGEQAELRRKEATRAMIRYFLLGFGAALLMGALVAYAVYESRARARQSYDVRVEYCQELENLKAQNREEVAQSKRDYRRTLDALGVKDAPKVRRLAEEGWARKLRRNAPRACPYDA